MATNPVYGVTAEVVSAYIPGVPIGSEDDMHPAASVTQIVKSAATQFNRVLVGCGGSPATVAADVDSLAYDYAQSIIARLAAARILSGIEYDNGDAGDDLREQAMAELKALKGNPVFFGIEDPSSLGPIGNSATNAAGIDTSDKARKSRTYFLRRHKDSKPLDW